MYWAKILADAEQLLDLRPGAGCWTKTVVQARVEEVPVLGEDLASTVRPVEMAEPGRPGRLNDSTLM